MLVNLLGVTILAQQPPKDTHSTNPNGFTWQSGLPCTSTFSKAGMSSFPLCKLVSSHSSARMNNYGLFYDQTILHQLTNILTGIRHRNLVNFVRIKPDLSFPTFKDTRCQSFLKSKRHHSLRSQVTDENLSKTFHKSVGVSLTPSLRLSGNVSSHSYRTALT